VDTDVSTSSIVDKPSDEMTVKGAAVSTPAAVDEPGTEAAVENTAVGTPALESKLMAPLTLFL
jgi:hypothetical protein